MRIGKPWWGGIVVSGSAASVLSALAAYCLSARENRAPFAAINAVSHWLYGPAAYVADRPSLRHTLPGFVIHHASSLLWGTLYEVLLRSLVDRDAVEGTDRPTARGRPDAADRWATAAVVTAIGAFTDLRLVPPRLSPGFEHRLSKTGVAVVYLSFAFGLALAAQPRGGSRLKVSR
jgi:hypothetical protein